MKRTSTDSEYLDTGKVVIDADGIPVELPSTVGAKPGQAPKWTGAGFRWSWMDQYTDLYDDTY